MPFLAICHMTLATVGPTITSSPISGFEVGARRLKPKDGETENTPEQDLPERMGRLHQASADPAANWSREQAARQARRDMDRQQSLSLQYQCHYLRRDMMLDSGVNSHYRAVLERANRERLALALRLFASSSSWDDLGLARADSTQNCVPAAPHEVGPDRHAARLLGFRRNDSARRIAPHPATYCEHA